jgi:hypothetical protein
MSDINGNLPAASAPERRLVQIGNIQVEVDWSTARPANAFRIGDTVRVLEKNYDGIKSWDGFIVELLDMRGKPNLIVATVKRSYEGGVKVEFITYDGERETWQIAPHQVAGFSLDEALSILDAQIANDRAKLEDLTRRRNAFAFAFGRRDDRIEQILVDARVSDTMQDGEAL